MTDAATLAKQRLEELVSFYSVNADAAVSETEDGIGLDIASTPATPRLIGHHGETLRALEYIVNQMVKRDHGDSPRIAVDIAGYRAARRDQLEQMARDAAARVVASGQEEELAPMNPAERRIVHMVLRDLSEVATESRGEDRSRRIVVLPKA
jgi:spoIIIJ-associated protein